MPNMPTLDCTDKENIVNLYSNYDGLNKISKLYKTSPNIIKEILIEFNVEIRNSNYVKKSYNNLNISSKEIDVINGLLLSDGELTKVINNRQSSFRVTSIHKEFCKYIENALPSIKFSLNIRKSTSVLQGSSRNNKESYKICSLTNTYFTKLREQWYTEDNNFTKQIPNDISINPTVLYYLFLGDGYSTLNLKTNSIKVGICTDSFNEQSIYFLKDELAKLDLNFNILIRNKNQFRLMLYKKSEIQKFYEVIGNCKLNCFSYKWKNYVK